MTKPAAVKAALRHATREDTIALLDEPVYGDHYRQDEDPLWLPPPPTA